MGTEDLGRLGNMGNVCDKLPSSPHKSGVDAAESCESGTPVMTKRTESVNMISRLSKSFWIHAYKQQHSTSSSNSVKLKVSGYPNNLFCQKALLIF